ncbi:MAG: Wzz/FepE/Etk N-terminal domain-containing protein [Roseiarcus sp.]
MEVIAIFDVLRRHVYLIIMLTIVTGLAGYAISFFTPLIPERFESTATLLVRPHDQIRIEQNSSDKEYLDFPVAQTPVVESASKTYIQIIQSPALISEIVRQLGLDHRPKKKIEPGGNILLRMEAALKAFWDEVAPYFKDAMAVIRYGRVIQDDPFTKAVKAVSKGLELKSYEDTYVFVIKYSDEDPKVAADVANAAARLFIAFMENMRSSEGKDSTKRLQLELEDSRQRLVDARESVEKYKQEHGTFLYKSEYDERLRVISDLTVELAKLDAAYANESLAGTIEGNTYAKKRDRLLKALNEAQADLATLPTVERQLQLREADANVADATYGTVAKELKDAELTSIAAPEARLISPAMVPQTPSKPRHDLMGGLSLLCGLMVGVGLALFLEYVNRTARGVSDIEKFVGLKVIGTIPSCRAAIGHG